VRAVLILLTISALIFSPLCALAAHPEESSEIENLKKRIEALEAERAEPREPFVLERLSDKLRLGGLLEFEASFARMEGGDDESDLVLATAQLDLEASINDHIDGHMIFLHEEGEDESVVVDEAVLSLTSPAKPLGGTFSLDAGRMYLPFGRFESRFISDPLTLELGETNDTALALGWSRGETVVLRVAAFSGETDTVGDNDSIDAVAVSLEIAPAEGFAFGGSWISDLAESDIALVKDDPLLGNVYDASVPGAAAFVTLSVGDFYLTGEYVTALRSFERDVLVAAQTQIEPGELTGRRPSAWNAELSFAPNDRWEVAVKAEKAKDFMDDARFTRAPSWHSNTCSRMHRGPETTRPMS